MPASSFSKFWTISRYPYPPLQLISSICFLLFHKTERTPFIPNPIRLPLLFPLPLLCIGEPCSLSPLFLSRGGDTAHLSLKTRVKSQLHSYFIIPPFIMLWRKLCTIFSYKRAFSCDLLISFPPFSTTKFRSWYKGENHPALNPLPFYADYRQPSEEAITLCRNLISFLRCLGLNSVLITVFSCILYIVKINVIPARSTV